MAGSLRDGGTTAAAVRAALDGAAAAGAEVQLLDLRDFELPLLDRMYSDAEAPAAVAALRQAFREARRVSF